MAAVWLAQKCAHPGCKGSQYTEEDFDGARLVSVCLLCGRRREVARLGVRPVLPEVPPRAWEWLMGAR